MMTRKTLILEGGPWFVARRKFESDDWQVNDKGFPTKAEADAYIKTQSAEYQYSVIDTADLKPLMSTTYDVSTKH